MENQSSDCGEVQLLDADDSEPQNADDVHVTENVVAEQQSAEDQDESKTAEVKIDDSLPDPDDKTPFSTGDADADQMDMSSNPRSELDPELQDSSFSDPSNTAGSENRNTHRKTGADLRILGTFMKSLNETRPLETIPPTELDKNLSAFFLIIKKTDGSEYEPCSLRAMLASIERYLRQKNYPASLTRDREFSNMRKALRSKQQMLRSLGKGQKSTPEVSQLPSMREGKLTQLFQSHEMGSYSPNSVIFSLCFFICMYLKLRKSIEHKKLLWGDIVLCQDYNKREYLTFSQQMLSKVQSSQRFSPKNIAEARIWAEPEVPDRDPITLYKFYAQKRPSTMNQHDAPFYLGLNMANPLPSQSWYRPAALGVNKLNEIVRQVRDLTGPLSDDNSSQHYVTPTISHDILSNPAVASELSNASSDPSSRDDHNTDSVGGLDGKDATGSSSPQLTIDIDGSYTELISSMAHALNQPLSLVRESESSDEQSLKSPGAVKPEEGGVMSPSVAGAADGGDSFQHQVASMNAARVREMLAQSSQLDEQVVSDDDEDSGFIGIEQAKELVTDIIRRMDVMDMAHFDRWLKAMSIGRDSHTGQVVCKNPVEGSSRKKKYSSFHDNDADNESSAGANMNILLNISLTPSAMRGQGPLTVQATTLRAEDLNTMSDGPASHSQSGLLSHGGRNSYNHWSGNEADSDSPLDLALNSLRGTSGPASGSRHAFRTSSTSSLAGAAGECSPAKQRKRDSAFHQSSTSKAAASHSGAAVVRNSPSRRKMNPTLLTHIRPRTSDVDTGDHIRRMVTPMSRQARGTHAHASLIDEELIHLLNLKQEME